MGRRATVNPGPTAIMCGKRATRSKRSVIARVICICWPNGWLARDRVSEIRDREIKNQASVFPMPDSCFAEQSSACLFDRVLQMRKESSAVESRRNRRQKFHDDRARQPNECTALLEQP